MDFNNLNWADNIFEELIDSARKETDITEEEWNSKISNKEDELIDSFIEIFSRTFPPFIEEKKIPEMNQGFLKFEMELRKDYLQAFNYLDTFYFLFSHFGIEYFKSIEKKIEKERLFILNRLFFKAIQVSNEIFYLLKGGFPNGALARWRSLHEITMTFVFLKNGPIELVGMYQDFDVIEKYRRLQSVVIHHKELGWPAPTEEVEILRLRTEEVKQKYGTDFAGSYGWTKLVLPKGKRTISGIEEYVGFNHIRSLYSYAGDDIHAGIGGIATNHGTSLEENVPNWGGKNIFNFIDPVQFTTSTLYTLTYYLVSGFDTLGNNIYIRMLKDYRKKVVEEFIKCEDLLRDKYKRNYKPTI
jgi:hypothetical protein